MVYHSKYKAIDIPQCNILSYLFPGTEIPSEKPVWIDAMHPERWLSPAKLLQYVRRFALGLDRLGVPINEAVMVFTPNHIFVPAVYLGAAGSKRYYTGANPSYTVDELAYQMEIVKPAVVLIHPSLFSVGYAAVKNTNLPRIKIFLFSDTDCLEQDGICDWKTMLAPEAEATFWEWEDLANEATNQIATINFSSGTTGLPKGVCISHFNLVANACQTLIVKLAKCRQTVHIRDERWLAFLPLYHAFSQLFTINIACRLQVSVYIMQTFSFTELLRHIQQYQITTMQAVPPVMSMLAKRPETSQHDISSLKNVMVGAAALSVQLSNNLTKQFGFCIARGWGMTETTCVGMLIPDDVRELNGASGYLLPNTEAKTVDDEGQEVEDIPGELWIRGPQRMLGYWKNQNATREICTGDGWLKTGDIVVAKDDLWWVVDRKKEIMKVNGLQVAPTELEAVLLQHEHVSDVGVVGLIVDGTEYPRAYIVRRSDTNSDDWSESDV